MKPCGKQDTKQQKGTLENPSTIGLAHAMICASATIRHACIPASSSSLLGIAMETLSAKIIALIILRPRLGGLQRMRSIGIICWCWNVINNAKDDSLILIDPVGLASMVVELDEDIRGNLILKAAPHFDDSSAAQVQDTIQKLGLNSRVCVIRRNQVANQFIMYRSQYDDTEMRRQQPFVFDELRRLGRL